MKKLSGGQAAVESLKAEKVEHVFGLIGSATMEMFDALYDASDINFIGFRDERTGTQLAEEMPLRRIGLAWSSPGKMAPARLTVLPVWLRLLQRFLLLFPLQDHYPPGMFSAMHFRR